MQPYTPNESSGKKAALIKMSETPGLGSDQTLETKQIATKYQQVNTKNSDKFWYMIYQPISSS